MNPRLIHHYYDWWKEEGRTEEMVGSTIFFSCAGVTYVPLAVAQILSETMGTMETGNW